MAAELFPSNSHDALQGTWMQISKVCAVPFLDGIP
jgi:hypothetical protein